MLKKYKLSLIIVVIAMIASCNQTSTPYPNEDLIQATQVLRHPTIRPTNTAKKYIATSTISPVTVSPSEYGNSTLESITTQETTPATLIDARLNIQCLDVLSKIPTDVTVTGIIALDSLFDPPLLWNIETGEKTIMPEEDTENIRFGGVSSDGRWMVYDKINRDGSSPESQIISWQLYVSSSDKTILVTSWEDSWTGSARWLDSNYIAINTKDDPLNAVLMINPFDEKKEVYSSYYPNIETSDVPFQWEVNSFNLAVYDPTRNFVVYPSWSKQSNRPSYIIWDLQNDEIVTELLFPANYSYPPKWAPDGENFVIANLPLEYMQVNLSPTTPRPHDELYLISRGGDITQLTTFSSIFEQSTNIYHYQWSPNGQYIAFWLDTNLVTDSYEPDGELAVLNVQTNEVKMYCIRGEFKSGGGKPPIWSPNSQQLLVESVTDTGESRVVLVDIKEGFAVEMIRGYIPIGWMVSTQE